MINRIVRIAVIAGLIAGVLSSCLQQFWATPLILAAETYEQTAPIDDHSHDGHDHEHDDSAWAPRDGLQRTSLSFLTNIVLGTACALILAAIFLLRERDNLKTGILWGAAGFATFHLAPAVGLPPELPGTVAAGLSDRQLWWAGTAICTAGGLALLAFGRTIWIRLCALPVLILPQVIGAPQPDSPFSTAPGPLREQFIIASLTINALMWLTVGGITGWLYERSGNLDE